jgi:hypothetical protein
MDGRGYFSGSWTGPLRSIVAPILGTVAAVAVLGGGCLLPPYLSPTTTHSVTSPAPQYDEARRLQLGTAQAALKAREYQSADILYRDVLRPDSTGRIPLQPDDLLSAREGRCVASSYGEDALHAAEVCKQFQDLAGDQHPTLATVWPRIAKGCRRTIETAIRSKQLITARGALQSCRKVPDIYQRGRIAKWRAQIDALDASAEAAREESLRKERQERLTAARERLSLRYSVVQGLTVRQFESWVQSATTVLGAQIFTDVVVEGRQLTLWVGDYEVMWANLVHFVEYNDAFTVWCNCDGVTNVGLDFSARGAGRQLFYQFRIDPRTGRSALYTGD